VLDILESKEKVVMDYELIKYLRDMGITDVPVNKNLIPIEDTDDDRYIYLTKNYFNDPRDPVTGEVPF